MKKNKDEKK